MEVGSCVRKPTNPEHCFRIDLGTTYLPLCRPGYGCYGPYLITSSAFISAPKNSMEIVYSALGAEYDFQSDRYLVDCAKATTAPDFKVTFKSGDAFSIPAKDYIRTDVSTTGMVSHRRSLLVRNSRQMHADDHGEQDGRRLGARHIVPSQRLPPIHRQQLVLHCEETLEAS